MGIVSQRHGTSPRPCTAADHRRTVVIAGSALLILAWLFRAPAYAASGDINTVIDSIRNWVAALLAALATLFLTIGGAT